jgi:hypothetical protein
MFKNLKRILVVSISLFISLLPISSVIAQGFPDPLPPYHAYLPFIDNNKNMPAWQIHSVDTQGVTGYYPSLAILGGKPAISYLDFTNQQIKFTRARAALPAQAEDWVTMNVTNGTGISGLAVTLDGRPAFCSGSYTLMYDIANTSTPNVTSDWSEQIVDNGLGELGGNCSLKFLPDGRPAISYWYENGSTIQSALKFAIAKSANPKQQSDWTIMTIETNTTTASNSRTSLAVVGGKPAISYFYPGTGLKYARANVANPSSAGDWVAMPVGGAGNARIYNRLKVMTDGTPVVAFTLFAGTYPNLQNYPSLARASSPTPASASDWTVYSVDTGANSDQGIDATALSDGMPAVVYYDNNLFQLIFARGLIDAPAQPQNWKRMSIDPALVMEMSMELLPIGKPAVAYQALGGGLKFAIGWDIRGLQTPMNVQATKRNPTDGVVVTWDLPDGIKPGGYKIYRAATSQDGVYSLVQSVGDVRTFKDTSVSTSLNYWYKVAATKPSYSDSDLSAADMGTIDPWWDYVVDPTPGFGTYAHGAITSDGKPGVVYVGGNNKVFYARATKALPASPSDWVITQVGTTTYAHYTTLIYLPGNIPLIAYHDNSDFKLMLAKGTKKEPSLPTDWDIAAVNDCGPLDISMALTQAGFPAISFMDINTPNHTALYKQATNITGPVSGWVWQSVSLEGVGEAQIGPSMAMLSDGRAVVCYEKNSGALDNPTLDLRCALGSTGGSWTKMSVDQPGAKVINPGSYIPPSLSVAASGNIAVLTYTSYDTSSSTYRFRFARAKKSDPSVQTDWTLSTIDSHALNNIGQSASLQVNAGVPVVAYNSGGDLKYAVAKSATPAGTADWNISNAQSTTYVNDITLLYLSDGKPAMDYVLMPNIPANQQLHFIHLVQ